MPREPEAMRDNIAFISSMMPGKAVFKPKEVCTITGLSFNTVKKHFNFAKSGYISIGDLARQISSYKN